MLSAFRTVATTTLEVEAHIFPTHLRVRHRAQRTIANLHTLPREHTMWSTLARAQRRRNNIGSYARFPLAEALKTMDLQRLNELETIDPRTLAPWRVDPFEKIEIDSDGEVARGRAEDIRSKSDIVVYSDASGRDGHLGAAVVAFATGPGRADGPLVGTCGGSTRRISRSSHRVQDSSPATKTGRSTNDCDNPLRQQVGLANNSNREK